MYNFFQSQIRRDIKTIIYKEDSFSVTLFDTEYFWIKKTKHIWPLWLSRFQVLGVELPTNNTERIKDQVQKIHRDYKTSPW
jgi:hypothetical protein